MPPMLADVPRFRFRLHERDGGAQCVDVVECAASRRMLVDKHAHVADPRGPGRVRAASAFRELDLMLALGAQTHVVRLEGYALVGERLHLLQEFCARGDLWRLVRREQRMTQAGLLSAKEGLTTCAAGVRTLFRQAVRGVAELHSAGIAHMDLSLENVLLTDSGVVKVADLGHAVRVHNKTVDVRDVSIAKQAFAAPEMHADVGEIDLLKVDAWALGVILYALCAKRPLVGIATDQDAVFRDLAAHGARRVLQSSPVELLVDAPAGLVDLLSRLLDVNPTTRMSVTAALHHPWLSDVVARQVAAARTLEPVSGRPTNRLAIPKTLSTRRRSLPVHRLETAQQVAKRNDRHTTAHVEKAGRVRTHSAEIALVDTRVAITRPSAAARDRDRAATAVA